MARVNPLLPTFARGEVSPSMFGRSDLQQYSACLDKCRNCWVRPYGLVSRMAGTQYVNTAKGKARLLKFVFSPTDSYMIECGAGWFRFYNNGAIVVKTLGDTSAWATSTAYVIGDFVQESSTIYYCIEAHTSGTFATDLAANKWVAQSTYEVPNSFTEAQLPTIQYVQLDDIIKISFQDDDNNSNNPLELIRTSSNNWLLQEVDFICTPFLKDNTSTTTLTASATTGTITVTASSAVFNSNHVGSFWRLGGLTTVGSLEKQGFFKITGFTSTTSVTAEVQWTLSTTSATDTWTEGAWSDYRGYPSTIGLLNGRIYYGRTPNNPRNVYGSRIYSYEDFTPATVNEDDGAINVELATNASGDGSDIKNMIGTSYLFTGTFGNEFVVKSSGDSGITPSDVNAKSRTNWGSENIQPILIDYLIHYVQRGGEKVRQILYDYINDTYKSIDVSLYSEHLFTSPIIDLAYQKNPDSLLYCLREDGKIAILTTEIEQEVKAWALLEFDGVVESVETIPSYDGRYDEVYLIIKRTINGSEVRHIERMRDIITPDNVEECWYVRDGLSYNGYSFTTGNDLTLSALTGDITVTAGSSIFTSDMVNKRIRYIDDDFNILGEVKITSYTSGTEVDATVRKDFTSLTCTGGKWAISVNNISNLDHLIGEEVQILADGAVLPDETVDGSGEITIDLDSFYVIVGLGYQSYIKPLPLEVGSQNGTAVGKKKRVNEMSLRVLNTLGIKQGVSLNKLYNIQYRNTSLQMGVAQDLFTGIISNIKLAATWDEETSIIIEQSNPLPMNILAISPIVNEVDK